MGDSVEISRLVPTQAGLRAYAQLPRLIEEVRTGKIFNDKDKSPILISRFKRKYSWYVHNGHHRVVSCILAGRTMLREDEVEFLDWDNPNPYHEFNWDKGFITPFHIDNEARLADLDPFKSAVDAARRLYLIDNEGKEYGINKTLEKFIIRNPWLYKCQKTVQSMKDLAIISMAGITSQVTDFRVRT